MNADEVLVAALDKKTAAERAAYLNGACGTDAQLRSAVEGLLKAHQAAGSFLEEPLFESTPTCDVPPGPEMPGTQVGPYKLLEQIGEGGFGVVFMAEQQHPIRRKVALKILKPGMDTRQVIARFEAERQALALMDHPNIAKVLDGGETDSGRPYFVMDLVKGIPITEYCDEAQLNPRERLELFVSVCQAVQHAHQKGIIHRDLKPSNILVTHQDGAPLVKIIDFGIAKVLGQQLTDKTLFTGFVQLVGTPLYMSPEQAALSNVDVDTRSDIYALGLLLYELLTGSTPFDKDRLTRASYEEMRRIIREEDPPKPSTRVNTLASKSQRTAGAPGGTDATSDVTSIFARRKCDPKRLSLLLRGELDWIVMKCLEKDRNRRYESANSLGRDIQHYLRDEPVQACPPSVGYRFGKLLRRHKVLFTVGAVLATTLLLSSAIVTWKWREAEAANQHEQASRIAAEKAEEQAHSDRDQTIRAERTARLHEADALVGQAHGTRLSRQPGQRLEALAALSKAAAIGRELGQPPQWFDALRTEAIGAFLLPDLEVAKEWDCCPVGTTDLAMDPSFERYARSDKDGNVSIRRVADDSLIHSLLGLGGYSEVRFSPDGRFLDQKCPTDRGWNHWRGRVWKLDGPEPVPIVPAEDDLDCTFEPECRRCALSYPDGTIRLFDLTTAKETGRFRHRVAGPVWLAWNPRYSVLAIRQNRSELCQIVALDTGKVQREIRVSSGITWLSWHPEGQILALSSYDYKIYLFDYRNGQQVLPPLEGHKVWGINCCFNHAGDWLASNDWSALLRVWDAHTGQPLLVQGGASSYLQFSRDDALVGPLQVGDKIRLLRCTAGKESRALRARTGEAFEGPLRTCIGVTGRCLAVATANGISLIDVLCRKEAGVLPVAGNHPLCFDGNDHSLWTYGKDGLLRWPIQPDSADANGIRVGPPERLANWARRDKWGASRDGKVLAIPNNDAGAILWHRPSNRTIPIGPQEDVRCCAVSPDGRWVATGSHWLKQGNGAKTWDAQSGQFLTDLPVRGLCFVAFSPHGKWLTTSSDGCRLWESGTWREGPKLNSPADNPFHAFSADEKLLALGDQLGVVRLVIPDTGREIARLTIPETTRVAPVCFTPDGTQLIAMGAESQELYFFDLATIRKELQEMKLDWDASPLPAAPAEPIKPVHMTIDPGNIRQSTEASRLVDQANRLNSENKHAEALTALRDAVKIDPTHATAHNNLAWRLLVGPKELRDAKAALPLARRAVELAPNDYLYHNTLGVALYRSGDFQDAITELEESLAAGNGNADAFDLFFLAMCHQSLGDPGKAKDCYDRAIRWFKERQGKLDRVWIEELKAFQSEAAALLAEPAKAAKD